MNNEILNRAADNIRILSAAMVEQAKSGHPGGAMGGADFINLLYTEFMNYDPKDPRWINRDRFFMDPGHMSPMLYSQLHLLGHYNMEDLKNFRQWGSPTPGHPEVDLDRGVENTSGPLGQGHTMAIGAAIAERFLVARFGEWMAHKTYAFISDGGIQEEISQGAGRIAGHLGLGNLIMFYDANDIQLSTEVDEVTSEDVEAKYKAWGWHVVTVEGNNVAVLRDAMKAAQEETGKPSLIIGKTIMGKGAVTEAGENFERKVSTHGQPLGAAGASLAKTVENLGGDAANPFAVFEDVAKFYAEVLEEKADYASTKKAEQAEWAKAYPELAAKLETFFSGEASKIDWASIEQKQGVATRAASATVLGHLAENVENMIVSSADLSNSDKTDGFLKKTHALAKGDFTGAFLQAGVCEFTMAVIANGIALHGGVQVAVATFFVFSDYMKPAFRLSALMGLPVKYIWTHDAFRVGEDGPTHQPIEQEAQIRLMEKLKNHHGDMSLLALRPADADEATVAWKMAMENVKTPTALIFSRQNITSHMNYEQALGAERGAYVVKAEAQPDVILVASGSEVATLMEGATTLEAQGLKVRVVSAPSEGLFRAQDKAYQQEVLPTEVPTFGMTAGLPVTLEGLVGPFGRVFGLDHFGYSAPAGVLDQKFGFTGENVVKQVTAYLEDFKK
ncbi:transketolase [Persicobacter psychrovividus]|uniref:Transketolase n=1 Tax=Persicobacter psychrovividus TaxID=387638 RepID=A0ABM7VEC7_9BACT|nr:transketolase [Persicobacter psychrovividus]